MILASNWKPRDFRGWSSPSFFPSFPHSDPSVAMAFGFSFKFTPVGSFELTSFVTEFSFSFSISSPSPSPSPSPSSPSSSSCRFLFPWSRPSFFVSRAFSFAFNFSIPLPSSFVSSSSSTSSWFLSSSLCAALSHAICFLSSLLSALASSWGTASPAFIPSCNCASPFFPSAFAVKE